MAIVLNSYNLNETIRIGVNAIQYKSIIGNEFARLVIDEKISFEKGDPIVLVEMTSDTKIPTGRTVLRYVSYIESMSAGYGDSYYVAIRLVPARCMLDELQRS